ncbi:hypothetical protein HU200_026218 [Digitaria exilis]|uniref:Uncharacterized protein n=1 Tax=Digitaria exilis TaxID=1010633 RepID=A0A835BZ08_9POAL|nr:hypothetical protein HU200_026218 [Digitaria exilis]
MAAATIYRPAPRVPQGPQALLSALPARTQLSRHGRQPVEQLHNTTLAAMVAHCPRSALCTACCCHRRRRREAKARRSTTTIGSQGGTAATSDAECEAGGAASVARDGASASRDGATSPALDGEASSGDEAEIKEVIYEVAVKVEDPVVAGEEQRARLGGRRRRVAGVRPDLQRQQREEEEVAGQHRGAARPRPALARAPRPTHRPK